MAKKELKWSPLLGQWMLLSGAVFVDRGNSKQALQSLAKAGEAMKQRSVSLWIFPEGTRTLFKTPDLLPFKKGAFHLAVQAGVPIVPVVCENYWRLYHKRVFEGGTIRLKVLRPISTTGLTSGDVTDLSIRTREMMLKALQEISEPAPPTDGAPRSTELAPAPPESAGASAPPTQDSTPTPPMGESRERRISETSTDESMVFVDSPAGHRGTDAGTGPQASAAFPENTLASFDAAIRDGAEGIESDVHVTKDDVVVMFHDPSLERTTGMKAIIRECNWHGEDGIHQARTLKAPRQAIPTFVETVDLLMKVSSSFISRPFVKFLKQASQLTTPDQLFAHQPENRHVMFNVDVKVQNDPDRLFKLIHATISAQPDWETVLAPRMSPTFARNWFWDSCDTFSMSFSCLVTADGEAFRKDCKAAGKSIMVWTVNAKEEMMECVRWGVKVILTDHTRRWLDLRQRLSEDYTAAAAAASGSKYYFWTNWKYYSAPQSYLSRMQQTYLIKVGGPFPPHPTLRVSASA
ncbi:hypothetical protein FRB99_007065 [Tulasnella sp. 403]|nr:hypothetical protein FRB99_007065 [Tulasnella sp. 403]